MSSQPPTPFTSALLIIDYQNDFCPPNGSLAVPSGDTLLPLLNKLLNLPFALKICTRDFHPPTHISFLSNHINATTAKVVHPDSPSQSYITKLWPEHCVQGTNGANLVAGLHLDKVDAVVDKGLDARVEMYSAFHDPFRVEESRLGEVLKEKGITHVFVVGLALDYCVKYSAADAKKEGFEVFIIEEASKAVDPQGGQNTKVELEGLGVKYVAVDGEEVGWVK
ncbi:MAG: NAD(+) salvage pathway protein [Vezdaea aestivalis]|nr:MAG: NAD(+) salvage pathway protein [Vezdaea aestivalis]